MNEWWMNEYQQIIQYDFQKNINNLKSIIIIIIIIIIISN